MRRLLAIAAAVLLPAVLMIVYRMRQTTAFASVELIVYPLLFGTLGIVVIVALKRGFLREPLSDLDRGPRSLGTDLLHGLGLTAVYFTLFFLFRATLANVLGSTPNLELLGLMLDMRERPLLLLIWFGPVLWIGIALYEELTRAFLLTELWSFSRKPAWVATAIALAAVLVGLVHWSQGPYGIVTLTLKSVVTGLYYWRWRRFVPLVLAHVLYDGLQVALLLVTYPA